MKKEIWTLLLVAGCTASFSTSTTSEGLTLVPTPDLWRLHYVETNQVNLSLIETELASRGESNTYSDYLGKWSSSAFGKALYQRDDEYSGDKNCSDFESAADAQRFFLVAGGPVEDAHGLDRDGDGLACEWGTHIKRVASLGAKRAQPTISYSRCYVGPRGGTYTITSGGYKDYDGC